MKSELAKQRTAGIVFWLWALTAIALAVIVATGFYMLGEIGGICVASISFLLVGIPQGIILQRFTHRVHWSKWNVFNALGVLVILPVALIATFIAGAGGGLNPETDVRGCFLQAAVVVGFLFGSIQNAHSSASLVWGFVHGIALTAGTWIGGLAGFRVYEEMGAPTGSETPERATSLAIGFLVGLTVYGLLTALAVAGSLRNSQQRKRPA